MSDKIRVKALDGTWEVLGEDRYPGIYPEGISVGHDPNGPSSLTFTLKRDANLQHLEVSAFTPVEYMPDGDGAAWSGFVIEAPASGGDDPQLNVSALGWWNHGADDTYSALYVHEDLTEWIDFRSQPQADLNAYTSSWQIQSGDGQIAFGYPGPHRGAGGWTNGGVLLDLGYAGAAKTIAIDWVRNAAWAGIATCYFGTSDDLVTFNTQTVVNLNAAGANSGTFISGLVSARYVLIICDSNGVQDAATFFKVTGARVFGDATYCSGAGQSVFTATQWVKDAARKLLLTSPDESLIATTTFGIRHAVVREEAPTASMERANSYHAYRLKVDEDRRVTFQPQSTRALLGVDVGGGGVRWEDSSAQSGRDIYNRVVVTGKSGSGADLVVVRRAIDLFPERVAPAPINGALPGVGDWTDVNSNIYWIGPARSTVDYRTAPASGAMAFLAGDLSKTATTPTSDGADSYYRRGLPYTFEIWVKAPAATTAEITFQGTGSFYAKSARQALVANTWTRVRLTFIPTADMARISTTITTRIYGWGSAGTVYVDDVKLNLAAATLPDRRGFVRSYKLTVGVPTDPAAMAALGDAYLSAHARTQLRGTLTIASDQAVKLIGSGPGNDVPIPIAQLGRYTGELIMMRDIIDPDTGDYGRVGQLVNVSKGEDQATMSLDNDRASFQALLNRMGATQGQPA